jgi:glycosidase
VEGIRFPARAKEILKDIYGEEKAMEFIPEFAALVRSSKGESLSSGGWRGKPTEHDVMVITYPDQIRAEGIPPLSALSVFFEKNLKGLIRQVHILPFFPSSSDDGFAVIDYRAVDPALGSWDDIAGLSKHFGLMVDAVLNHASAKSAWFQAFLRSEEPYRGFFLEQQGPSDLSQVVRPRTSPLLHRFGSAPMQKTVWTTFSGDQVDLNYHNPRVLLEMTDLLLFYAAHGASILRLDAVAYLWKEVGTSCISLPQTHRIVQFLHAILEEAAPGVLLATETNVPHEENISYAGDGGNEAHLIYNFALPPLILHTFLTGDSHAFSRWVEGLSLPGRETAFLNFLASHDGIGLNAAREILQDEDLQRLIRTTLDRGGYLSLKKTSDGSTLPYELNINYFDALSDPFGGEAVDMQIRRFLCAHAILLCLAGVPAIYFHSLFGSRGWREGVRQTGRNRSINRQKLDWEVLERELADETGIRRRVFSGLAAMIRARGKTPAFDPYGEQKTVDCGSAVFCLLRSAPQTGEQVLCLQEISGRRQSLLLDVESILNAPAGKNTIELISGKRITCSRENPLLLDPYHVCWVAVR